MPQAPNFTSAIPPVLLHQLPQRAGAMFAAIQGVAQLRAGGRLDLLTDASAKDLADILLVRVLRDVEHRQA